MKKLMFYFVLVIIFSIGYSDLMAQSQPLSAGKIEMLEARQGGLLRSREVITNTILQLLPGLNSEFEQLSQDPLASKAKQIQILLYKGMVSDLKAGLGVRDSYNANVNKFLDDYPHIEGYYFKKKDILNAFNSIVFIN